MADQKPAADKDLVHICKILIQRGATFGPEEHKFFLGLFDVIEYVQEEQVKQLEFCKAAFLSQEKKIQMLTYTLSQMLAIENSD